MDLHEVLDGKTIKQVNSFVYLGGTVCEDGGSTVAPRYNAPRYYADSDITRSVVDPDFLPPG